MNEDKLELHREDMKIEGDRNLYNFTFTDSTGKLVRPEPTLPPGPSKPPSGNLDAEQGENRKG